MKVDRIETLTFWGEWKNWVFVKVSTDDGLYGWGEASLAGAVKAVESAVHELGAVLIGEDPGGVERHWLRMYHAWRWRGGAIQTTAQAALDIALWDLEGKRLGVPSYRLLGGPYRDRIRAYASHWLIGADTPEKVREQVREVKRRGFDAFKWSPFDQRSLRENENAAIEKARQLMEVARDEAGPEMDIFVECGEKLSLRTAPIAAQAFLPYRPGWFEEPIPCENAKAMVELQHTLPVPIATGERLVTRWEYRELLEGQGCRIIQPDLTHCSGITEVKRICSMADTYYISVAPHNSAGPIGTLAALNLAAAIPNFFILEQMEEERSMRDAICTVPLKFENGSFELPTAPGLGTDLKLDVLLESEARAARATPLRGGTERIWR
ncbi:MAG: mandelate racemase/muconate lactonizing enzyme family protein [Chloroflexi bacterium]|nr:mandelate racemase/muconate lactonizing enzyme family protein [Chloroflexota bacterium]